MTHIANIIRVSTIIMLLAVLGTSAMAGMAPYDIAQIDWRGAIAAHKKLGGDNLGALRSIKAVTDQIAKQKRADGLSDSDILDLATINAVTTIFRPEIAAAGSPVLLPFDFKKLSNDLTKATSLKGAEKTSAYFGRLNSLAFHPGPYGYRAYLRLKKTSTVMISGSSILYRLSGDPTTPTLQACDALIATAQKANSDAEARDSFFKELARYERRIGLVDAEYFGETEAAIPCLFAGALIEVHILCDSHGDPDCKVRDLAQEIVSSLSFVGGAPRSKQRPGINDPIQRLSKEVSDLESAVAQSHQKLPSYSAPGDLVEGSGVNGKAGSKDTGVYGPILFPTDLSASAQTVVYRSDEECLEGDTNNGATCETRSGRIIMKAPVGEWRDNFCEARSGNRLFTCPDGHGHAGQDIWGKAWNDTLTKYPLRAVVDGIAFRRFPAQPAVTLSDVNGSNIDYIYRHMRPSELDKSGIVASRPQRVTRGCILAPVDRLQNVSSKRTKLVDNGISYDATAKHLHFEIRIPTKSGFQNVSPYQTVVDAHRAAKTKVDTSPASQKSCL